MQFDALLAILEQHIKKKATNFCEHSVQGSLWCFVLRDEVDELDIRLSGFWRSIVRWLWIVKTPLKMLTTHAKNAESQTRSEYFYDRQKRQCVLINNDVQKDGWMDGRDGSQDQRIKEGWNDGWMDGWMDRWIDGWTDGWTNVRINDTTEKSIKSPELLKRFLQWDAYDSQR